MGISTTSSSSMALDGGSFSIERIVCDALQFGFVAGEAALDDWADSGGAKGAS